MGTSLSGLTPQTTFDGLLKTSDNDALDATLKTIGTGDGTDSILQLSNTAFQVNGEATIVGATNDTSASAIFAQNSDAYTLFQVRNDGTTLINNASYQFSQPRFVSTKETLIYQGLAVGQTTPPSARLHIKGSGATSATTSLLVQNSTGTDLMKVEDGGNIVVTGFTFQSNIIKPNINGYIGLDRNSNRTFGVIDSNGTRTYLNIQSSSTSDFADVSINTDHLVIKKEGIIGIGETTPTARLQVKGSGATSTTTALLVQNSDADNIVEVLDSKRVNITAADGATGLHIDSVNGSTSGTALTIGSDDNKFRLGNYYNYGVIAVPSSKLLLSTAQGVGIGDSFTNANGGTARLFVKGSGATSATTALLVQNSAGTDLLKVRDDGWIEGISTLNSTSVRITGNLQVGGTNFKVDNTNTYLQSQFTNNVFGGVNTDGDASALVTMKSTTQGFLPPRMTTAQKTAITAPAAGLMVYDTDQNQMNYWNGSGWIAF